MAKINYDFVSRHKKLTRDILYEGAKNLRVNKILPLKPIQFIRILSISNFWTKNEISNFSMIMSDILCGINGNDVEFVYLINSILNETSIYIGISPIYTDILTSALRGAYPYIQYECVCMKNRSFFSDITYYGGVITGYPINKHEDKDNNSQIEKILRGAYGKEFVYCVVARSIDIDRVNNIYYQVIDELTEISSLVEVSLSTSLTSVSKSNTRKDYMTELYYEKLKVLKEKIEIGLNRGYFESCTYYLSPDEYISENIRKNYKSIFAGSVLSPEPIRCIRLNNIETCVNPLSFIEDDIPINGNDFPNCFNDSLFQFRYKNILNSDDLSIYCPMPRCEIAGYAINDFVEFDISRRIEKGNFNIGQIMNHNYPIDYHYTLDINDLNRHGLIIGITGGGKTNTAKSLLVNLWNHYKKPYLVIEAAKREYWQLANTKGLESQRLYTLGQEGKNSLPLRINPFERIGDVPLQTHIDYLFSTFKASFELYPPMPYVLETSIYEVYADRGWDIINDSNELDRDDYPTIEDLYYKIESVVNRLGYDKRLTSDIKSSLMVRINSLMVGGKGAMLNTRKSTPISQLLNYPTVIELEDIGDDDVKAFLIGIILVQIYEYRKLETSNHELKHLILIEEAHRLLKNVTCGTGDSANPRGNAVEFFCNLLAEVRSYGQGFLISDQIPSKLAPDTLKNTNLKIVHRTVTKEDRELIGNSMNMTEDQINYLSALKVGVGAVYSEGDNRPKLVLFPKVEYQYNISRVDIIKRLQLTHPKTNYRQIKDNSFCAYCDKECVGNLNKEDISDKFTDKWIKSMILYIEKEHVGIEYDYKLLNILSDLTRSHIGILLDNKYRLCVLNEFMKFSSLPESEKRDIASSYVKHIIRSEKGLI